jgi:hypothetical protein
MKWHTTILVDKTLVPRQYKHMAMTVHYQDLNNFT